MSELFNKWDNLFKLYDFIEQTSAEHILQENEMFKNIYSYFNECINNFAEKNSLDVEDLDLNHIKELLNQIHQKIKNVVEKSFGSREQLEEVYAFSESQFAPKEDKYKNSIVLYNNLNQLIDKLLIQYNNYVLVKNINADFTDFQSYEEFYVQALCISYFKYLFDSLYADTVYN